MTRAPLPLLAALLAVALPACKDDPSATPPVLGAQVDRAGRAEIVTTLVDPFNLDASARGTNEDAYNAAADPTQWGSLFSRRLAGNLAILDSLDAVCGNQLLADPALAAGRYGALADLLADDQLYLDTGSGSCTSYLAVELGAAGVPSDECGGRTPVQDVMDRSYSVLLNGTPSGVTDAVDRDADAAHSTTAFPFLAAPQ